MSDAVELQMQGVHPDMSAAQMQLLTAKMAPKDLSALKKLMLRPGFVEEWNSLDSLAAGFAKVLLNKANATPSVSYKLFTTYDPEAVLWLGFTTKDKAVRERYELFLKTWPEARQRIPHAQMQEMRITPELATYNDIVHQVFLQLIDGGLNTPEEIRAFLEPHSPPAPPPQVTIKRTRAKRNVEAKVKESSFDEDDEDSEDGLEEEDLDDIGGGDEEELDLGIGVPKVDELDTELGDEAEEEDDADEEDGEPVRGKRGGKPVVAAKRASTPKAGKSTGKDDASAAHAEPKHGHAPAQHAAHSKPAPEAKAKQETKAPVAAKGNGKPETRHEKAKAAAPHAPAKKPAHPVKPAAKIPVKTAKTTVKHVAKAHAKAPAKPAHNNHANGKSKHAPHAKPAKSHAPAKASKPAAKKPAHKAGRKH